MSGQAWTRSAPRRIMPGVFHLSRFAPIALCLAACSEAPQQEAREVARPDVVVYLIDTLRADYLSPYGAPESLTPNVARLAREGVVFDQASAAAPWTLPSVVSLMTSTFVAEHDISVDGRLLNDEVPTLAELMTEGGYATVAYFRNPYAGPLSGLERGFDLAQRLTRRHREVQIADWLGSIGERPFFCYFHTIEPHDPYRQKVGAAAPYGVVSEEQRAAFEVAARKYRALTRADFVKKQPLGTLDNTAEQAALISELDEMRPAIDALYTSMIAEADRRLGDLIAELEQAGRWEDTLFVLTSDHGEEMGEHGGWMHDQSLYEELVHVPMIVRFPGDAYAGRRVAAPVSLIDVMPTVLDLAGAPPGGARVRGRSLRGLLEGESSGEPRVTAMRINQKKFYRPFHEARGNLNVALREGDWKGIWNVELDTLELYDLANDPGETRDLSEAEPERVERLREVGLRTLAAAHEQRAEAQGASPGAMDDETRRALEGLGYVGNEDDE